MQKTIIFCVDTPHAAALRQALIVENQDPVLKNHRYVMCITGDDDAGKEQLDNFIDPESDYPVLVTTSRLLSTGVDAQTCRLIVLDRAVGADRRPWHAGARRHAEVLLHPGRLPWRFGALRRQGLRRRTGADLRARRERSSRATGPTDYARTTRAQRRGWLRGGGNPGRHAAWRNEFRTRTRLRDLLHVRSHTTEPPGNPGRIRENDSATSALRPLSNLTWDPLQDLEVFEQAKVPIVTGSIVVFRDRGVAENRKSRHRR